MEPYLVLKSISMCFRISPPIVLLQQLFMHKSGPDSRLQSSDAQVKFQTESSHHEFHVVPFFQVEKSIDLPKVADHVSEKHRCGVA